SMFSSRNSRMAPAAGSTVDTRGRALSSRSSVPAIQRAARNIEAAHSRYVYRYQLKIRRVPRGSYTSISGFSARRTNTTLSSAVEAEKDPECGVRLKTHARAAPWGAQPIVID